MHRDPDKPHWQDAQGIVHRPMEGPYPTRSVCELVWWYRAQVLRHTAAPVNCVACLGKE